MVLLSFLRSRPSAPHPPSHKPRPHNPHTMDVSGGNAWIESYLDALVRVGERERGRGGAREKKTRGQRGLTMAHADEGAPGHAHSTPTPQPWAVHGPHLALWRWATGCGPSMRPGELHAWHDGTERAADLFSLFFFSPSPARTHSSRPACPPSTRARLSLRPRPRRTGWTRTRVCSPSELLLDGEQKRRSRNRFSGTQAILHTTRFALRPPRPAHPHTPTPHSRQVLRQPDPAAGRGGHRVRLEPGK